VCTILEELVHLLMNVKDEGLVTQIVGHLYGGISIVDGKYTVYESTLPPS
jgi:hypothetical protein